MKETISSLAKLNYLSSSSDNKNCDDKISLAIDIAKEISNTDVASYQSFLNVQDENRFQKLLSRFKIAQKEYKKIPKETRDLFKCKITSIQQI